MGVNLSRCVIIVVAALLGVAAPHAAGQARASKGYAPIGPPIPASEPARAASRDDDTIAPAPIEPALEAVPDALADAPLPAEAADPTRATPPPAESSAVGANTPGANTPGADANTTGALAARASVAESQPLGAPQRPTDEPLSDIAAPASGDAAGDASVGPMFSPRTIGALALVIALALAFKWVLSRSLRKSGSLAAYLGPAGRAPSGVLTVLGRYPLSRRQSLVLLKVDRRVLLLAHGEAGAQTLTEITDPEDVASILVATRDDEGSSLSQRFHSMLSDLERDPSLSRDDAPLRETPMTPRRAFERGESDAPEPAGADDPVGSLRRRLASLREAKA